MAEIAVQEPGRKIQLPDYISALTGKSRGGRADCDHDFPEPHQVEPCGCCETWMCARCGLRRTYEVYD